MRILLVLVLLFPVLAHAASQNRAFIGAGYVSYSSELSVTDSATSYTLEGNGEGPLLKLGALINQIRLYGTLEAPSHDDPDTTHMLTTGNLDFLAFPRERRFNVFLGGSLALYQRTTRDFYADGSDFHMATAMAGLEAGLLFDAEPLQLEVGGRHLMGMGSTNDWDNVDTELDELSELFASLNYLF